MENLSDAGVPVLAMDFKGDLSGIGAEGEILLWLKTDKTDRDGWKHKVIL
jgi:hypothetical protein